MTAESELSCVISGSVRKFKPEIDLAIDEFSELGVTVLAPGKGWVYVPPHSIRARTTEDFRPLPGEEGLTTGQIEGSFLECLSRSDFVYIVNPGGYMGNTVSLEIGFALGKGIPVYSREKLGADVDADLNLRDIFSTIKNLSPPDVLIDLRAIRG